MTYEIRQVAEVDVWEGSASDPYTETPPFTSMNFTVTPSIPVDINVPVTISYGGGTATPLGQSFSSYFSPLFTQVLPFGTDYDGSADTITFTRSTTTPGPMTVEVLIVRDTLVEGGDMPGNEFGFGVETFDAIGSSTSPYTTAFDDGVGTIIDDDGTQTVDGVYPMPPSSTSPFVLAEVSVSAPDPDVSEPGGTGGDGLFRFSVSTPVQQSIIIHYSYTVDGLAGDPNGDIDSTTPFTGTITIPANPPGTLSPVTSVDLPIRAYDDMILENNEAVVVTITSIETDPNVTFSTAPATATITDDDTAFLSIEATDNMATEGGDNAELTIRISKLSDESTTFWLSDITQFGFGFASGSDYISTPGPGLPVQVTIPPLTPEITIPIVAVNDVLTEPTEQLDVQIGGPGFLGQILGNGDIAFDTSMNTAQIFIKDDGDGLFVNISSFAKASEPDVDGQFKFQLVDAFGNDAVLPVGSTVSGFIQFNLRVEGTATQQGSNSQFDYSSLGTATIQEGSSMGFLSVDVRDDSLVEGTETVILTILSILDGGAGAPISSLPGPTDAGEQIGIGTATATVEICDDDNIGVAGIYVNGTAWNANFRDQVDGTADASSYGYELTAANAALTVPWVNVNEIVVRFNAPFNPASLDPSDFDLTGLAMAGFKFDPGQMEGVVPAIGAITPFAGNTAVRLSLVDPVMTSVPRSLEPSVLTVAVNASGISDAGGIFGNDYDQTFLALPGDVQGTNYRVLSNDRNPITLNLGAALGSSGYTFRADLDGSGRILSFDRSQVTTRLGDYLLPPAPRPFSQPGSNWNATQPLTVLDRGQNGLSGPAGRAAAANPVQAASGVYSAKSELALAGSISVADSRLQQADRQLDTVDRAIDDLFGAQDAFSDLSLVDFEILSDF